MSNSGGRKERLQLLHALLLGFPPPGRFWSIFPFGGEGQLSLGLLFFSLTYDKNLKDMVVYWCSVLGGEWRCLKKKRKKEKQLLYFYLSGKFMLSSDILSSPQTEIWKYFQLFNFSRLYRDQGCSEQMRVSRSPRGQQLMLWHRPGSPESMWERWRHWWQDLFLDACILIPGVTCYSKSTKNRRGDRYIFAYILNFIHKGSIKIYQ